MTPPGMVGRLLKVVVLRRRIRGKNWAQLVAGARACHESFETLIAGETQQTAEISAGGEMSVLDTVAHLVVANNGIARRLVALRSGEELPPDPPDLWPGHGDASLEQVRTAYA